MKRRFYFKDGRVEMHEVDDTVHMYWNLYVRDRDTDPFVMSMWHTPGDIPQQRLGRVVEFERRVTHTPDGPETTYHELP